MDKVRAMNKIEVNLPKEKTTPIRKNLIIGNR